MARSIFFCVAVFFCACLPGVGPLADSGTVAADGGSVGAVCASPLECASGVCVEMKCVAAERECPPAFAGCSTPVDLTAADARRVITFPTGGDRYGANCIRVKLGQTVTFQGGDFGSHPLLQACGPVSGLLASTVGRKLDVTFTTALGVFGYYCESHGTAGGSGMAGAIEVVP